jgi:hypothetical protein
LNDRDLLLDGSLLATVGGRAEFESLREASVERHAYETAIAAAHRAHDAWTMIGWCQPCCRGVELICDWQHSDGTNVNFRERLACPHC